MARSTATVGAVERSPSWGLPSHHVERSAPQDVPDDQPDADLSAAGAPCLHLRLRQTADAYREGLSELDGAHGARPVALADGPCQLRHD